MIGKGLGWFGVLKGRKNQRVGRSEQVHRLVPLPKVESESKGQRVGVPGV